MRHDFTPKDSGKGIKVCVISCPLEEFGGGHALVHDLIKVLEPLADALFIISHNLPENIVCSSTVHIRNVKHDSKKEWMLIRVVKHVLLQLRISLNLVKISKSIDIVIFYLGGAAYLLPTLSAKLLMKKIVSIVVGAPSKSAKELYASTLYGYGGVIFFHILKAIQKVHYRFADRIVVESKREVREFELERYQHKITIVNCFFNTSLFEVKRNFSDRRNLIGYIGRLGEEKGVMNFVRALSSILDRCDDVEFLIGGDGELWEKIKGELKSDKFSGRVTLTGWIPYEQLIHYYNDLKLLVVPSYVESIPIVALEAMACGTPVLATPVGGVPDVIRDGENGFILQDNSPQCIADTVVKVLEHPKLGEIARAACTSVRDRYTYEAAKKRFRIILGSLLK